MKILLIRPPFLPIYKVYENLRYDRTGLNTEQRRDKVLGIMSKLPIFEPLGLGYIASQLVSEGHEVEIWDAGIDYTTETFTEEVIEKHINKNYDIFGINDGYTCTTPVNPWILKKINLLIKKCSEKAPTIMGGATITSSGPQVMNLFPNLKYLAYSPEGETIFSEFVKNLQNGKQNETLGMAIRIDNENIKINEPMPLIKDFDNIIYPSRDLYPKDYYKRMSNVFTLQTSRGCVNRCVFCTEAAFFHHKYRGHSAEYTIKDVKNIYDKFGEDCEFYIADSAFNSSDKLLNNLYDGLKRENIPFKTTYFHSTATISQETLENVLTWEPIIIFFGVESASPRIQKLIGKKVTIGSESKHKLLNSVKKSVETGAVPITSFILGNPTETIEDFEMSLSLAREVWELGGCPLFFPCDILQGTPLMNEPGKYPLPSATHIIGMYNRLMKEPFSTKAGYGKIRESGETIDAAKTV